MVSNKRLQGGVVGWEVPTSEMTVASLYGWAKPGLCRVVRGENGRRVKRKEVRNNEGKQLATSSAEPLWLGKAGANERGWYATVRHLSERARGPDVVYGRMCERWRVNRGL